MILSEVFLWEEKVVNLCLHSAPQGIHPQKRRLWEYKLFHLKFLVTDTWDHSGQVLGAQGIHVQELPEGGSSADKLLLWLDQRGMTTTAGQACSWPNYAGREPENAIQGPDLGPRWVPAFVDVQ